MSPEYLEEMKRVETKKSEIVEEKGSRKKAREDKIAEKNRTWWRQS